MVRFTLKNSSSRVRSKTSLAEATAHHGIKRFCRFIGCAAIIFSLIEMHISLRSVSFGNGRKQEPSVPILNFGRKQADTCSRSVC